MSAQAEEQALNGKSSMVAEVLEAASATQPQESLEDSWARLQNSSSAQKIDVSYEQSKIEDKSDLNLSCVFVVAKLFFR